MLEAGRLMGMDTIDNDDMQRAAEAVISTVQDGVDIHTIHMELSGQHGGVDVRIEGHFVPKQGGNSWLEETTRTYRVGRVGRAELVHTEGTRS